MTDEILSADGSEAADERIDTDESVVADERAPEGESIVAASVVVEDEAETVATEATDSPPDVEVGLAEEGTADGVAAEEFAADAAATDAEPVDDAPAEATDLPTAADAPPSFNVKTGSVVTQRYRLDEKLPATAPSTQVWNATDQVLERPVRLTLLGGPQATAALDAARRAALVTDPRLHRILDVGTTKSDDGEDLHYIVNEPLGGKTLADMVRDRPLSEEHVRAVIGETAQALDAAAKRGVHHVALRPDSIHFDNHRLIVSGLGVEAALANQPVHDRDGGAGAVTDARSLAALAYYARTGHWPGAALGRDWLDEGDHVPAEQHEDGQIVSLGMVSEDTTPELVDLTERALTDDEALHPRSPSEVVSELSGWDARAALSSIGGPAPARGLMNVSVVPGDPRAKSANPQRHSVKTSRNVQAVRNPVRRIARVAGDALPDVLVDVPSEPRAATNQVPITGVPVSIPPVVPDRGRIVPAVYPAKPVPVPGSRYDVAVPIAAPPDTYAVRRRGVNPTPIVLFLALAGLGYGGFWALRQLTDFVGTQIHAIAGITGSGSDTEEAPAVDPETGETLAAPEVSDVHPQIESIAILDPTERPENGPLVIDGDPSTVWYTFTYNTAAFGGLKPGVAVQIQLAEPATINGVELLTRSSGGMVEVHQAGASDPRAGAILAQGPFAHNTQLNFAHPVEGDSFTLWISELPEIGDNQYRLDIEEISLH